MIFIENVSDNTSLRKLEDLLTSGALNNAFVDGRHTAGHRQSTTKKNKQLCHKSIEYQKSKLIFFEIFNNNPNIKEKILGLIIRDPEFVVYTTGAYYKKHLDSTAMPTDSGYLYPKFSTTLFLNNPGDYKGGELVLHDGKKIHTIKGQKGDIVLYPSGLVHEVKPIISGSRKVAVSWIGIGKK